MKTNTKNPRVGDRHSPLACQAVASSRRLVTDHSSLSSRQSSLHPNSRSWLTPGRHGGILGRPFAVYLAALLCMTLSISVASAQNVNVSGSTGADGTYATLGAAFT